MPSLKFEKDIGMLTSACWTLKHWHETMDGVSFFRYMDEVNYPS